LLALAAGSGRSMSTRRKFHSPIVLVREDKEKNMSSLFARKRNLNPEMLTLPAFCVPAEESAELNSKREAQLEWMRSKGVEYILHAPVKRHAPIPEKRVA
jgi:hypothetical protein